MDYLFDTTSAHILERSANEMIHATEDPVDKVTRLFAEQNLHQVPPYRFEEMTPEERMAALADLHGALDIKEEEPQIILQKLQELDEALNVLPPSQREALDEAIRQDPLYVQGLRLRFLRAERFDVIKAAVRMARHFATRLLIFETPKVLGRDIRLSDLNSEEDKLAIQSGVMHLLPHRDRVGRPILFFYPASLTAVVSDRPYHFSSLLRLLFFMSCLGSAIGDDAQKKGLVILWYGLGAVRDESHKVRGPQLFDLFSSLPIRIIAIHSCYNDETFKDTFNNIGLLAESRDVLRFQTHFGGHRECQMNLSTFGIPQDFIPIDPSDGSFQMAGYRRFIAHLQEQDQKSQQEVAIPLVTESSPSITPVTVTSTDDDVTVVLDPCPKDIILGRGRRGDKSPGNQILRRLLEDNYDAYNSGARIEKTCITHLIFFQLHQAGYRFLVPCDEENGKRNNKDRGAPEAWIRIDEEAARHRIGHGFRNLRRSKK